MEILSATQLSKQFRSRGQTVEAVRDVSLRCASGEVVAFLGANGAGKTTTLKMLTGLIRPDRGEVSVCGGDPNRDARVLRHIGAVLEGNRNLYWKLTAQENLEYFGALRGMGRLDASRAATLWLGRLDLEGKRHTLVHKLSRGMQQKLAFAISVLHRPRLLLLDEPTLGLDVEATAALKSHVAEWAAEGNAVLLTTHQLDVAQELSSRVVIMRQGAILAEQSTAELIRQYSGQSYTVRFQGMLTEPQVALLSGLPIRLELGDDESVLLYFGEPGGLYAVLEALRPQPLVSIEPTLADLSDIFVYLNRDGAPLPPAARYGPLPASPVLNQEALHA
jgi:ABC-2 type transport system ATP-binding protein